MEIACPQFKNSFVLTYKGFFLWEGSQKSPAIFRNVLAHLGFRTSPSKFVFRQCKRDPTLLSHVKHNLKIFLLVIKITMINSDFNIFSLKSFSTRLEIPDSRRRRKLSLHVIGTWAKFLFQRDPWMKGDINRFKTWFVNHFVWVMNFQQLHCFQNVRNVFEWVYTDRSTQDGNGRSFHRSLSANPEISREPWIFNIRDAWKGQIFLRCGWVLKWGIGDPECSCLHFGSTLHILQRSFLQIGSLRSKRQKGRRKGVSRERETGKERLRQAHFFPLRPLTEKKFAVS